MPKMKKKRRQATRGDKRSAGQFRKNTSEKHQRGRYRRVNRKLLDIHSNTEAHTRKKMGQHEEADSTYLRSKNISPIRKAGHTRAYIREVNGVNIRSQFNNRRYGDNIRRDSGSCGGTEVLF